MRNTQLKQIYKITYPNGMIYVGMDLVANKIDYCGSPTAARQQIADDLGIEVAQIPHMPLVGQTIVRRRRNRIRIELPHLKLVLRKEILWESTTASDSEVRQLEIRLIRELGSNDPRIGYNRTPKYVGGTRCS